MNSIGPASLSGWSARYLNNQRQTDTGIGNDDLLKPRPALGTPLRNEAVDPAAESARQAMDEGFAKLNLTLKQNQANAPATASEGKSAYDEFKEYMQKSPAERMREQVLKSLGLTEEELDAMPPEKREQVEKGIGERMREMIAMQNGQAPGRQEDPTQAGAALNAWI
ncbi:hypothetical protein GHU06_26290 [Pseudomonas aeruginosa]|uniref:hypothetical protein n=1 Tax=Pseudomonas aeruginosa TaxID=287 RepID=UPI00053EC7E3|nr:hypothetical protein [Pseudomonas aeruginosa]EJB8386398.1 hypothetical protein [Pseudomonas aeruginosa]MBG6714529.1 hypothetical protein [Pseudomonas aeruginosa]MBG7428265.1 hypothetical protein [Pseudomonas aeruginosa]MBO2833428.1 hypothetical protein [Pseudomonas aeruginosa]MCT4938094.1 hypothetical protein [Pseudomonas aeruginosa]